MVTKNTIPCYGVEGERWCFGHSGLVQSLRLAGPIMGLSAICT